MRRVVTPGQYACTPLRDEPWRHRRHRTAADDTPYRPYAAASPHYRCIDPRYNGHTRAKKILDGGDMAVRRREPRGRLGGHSVQPMAVVRDHAVVVSRSSAAGVRRENGVARRDEGPVASVATPAARSTVGNGPQRTWQGGRASPWTTRRDKPASGHHLGATRRGGQHQKVATAGLDDRLQPGEFGYAWRSEDVDHNGCDTRNDILARDADVTQQKRDKCVVISGTLDDPYTGKTIVFAKAHADRGADRPHLPARPRLADGRPAGPRSKRTNSPTTGTTCSPSRPGQRRKSDRARRNGGRPRPSSAPTRRSSSRWPMSTTCR